VWPTGDDLEPWERYLYALTYLAFAIKAGEDIGPNLITTFPFPVLHGERHTPIMESVIQVLRRPQRLCPDSSCVDAAFTLSRNQRLTMTAAAAGHHIHDIGRNQRKCRAFSIRGHPRVQASMKGSLGWSALIVNLQSCARLVSLLEHFKDVRPGHSQ
jgi:hypothetical protein